MDKERKHNRSHKHASHKHPHKHAKDNHKIREGKDKDKKKSVPGDKKEQRKAMRKAKEERKFDKDEKQEIERAKKKAAKKLKKQNKRPKIPEAELRLKFTKRLHGGLRPLRHLLVIFAKYPFSCVKNTDTTYNFKSRWISSFGGIYFILMTIISIYLLLVGTFNIFAICLEVLTQGSKQNDTSNENVTHLLTCIPENATTFGKLYNGTIYPDYSIIISNGTKKSNGTFYYKTKVDLGETGFVNVKINVDNTWVTTDPEKHNYIIYNNATLYANGSLLTYGTEFFNGEKDPPDIPFLHETEFHLKNATINTTTGEESGLIFHVHKEDGKISIRNDTLGISLKYTNDSNQERKQLGNPENVTIDWCQPEEMTTTVRSFKKDIMTTDAKIYLLENVLLARHGIIVMAIWCALIHVLITRFMIMNRRKYMAAYFGLWTRAVLALHLDMGRKLYWHCFMTLIIFLTFISLLGVCAVMGIGATTRGVPALFSLLMFRTLHPDLVVHDIGTTLFDIYMIISGFIIFYLFIGSKGYILYFHGYCKALTAAFGEWNGRVYATVLRGGEFARTPEGRVAYKVLFKDHCLLVDLIEGTNKTFRFIIESYIGLQILCIIFEIYFAIRPILEIEAAEHSRTSDLAALEFYFLRPFDYIPGIIILSLDVWILHIVMRAAAEVGDEARSGQEILRRKTMLGRKTDEELYFMLSLFASYTSYTRIELCGGNYFYMNKEFIITVTAIIASMFIIVFQFQPVLDYNYDTNVTIINWQRRSFIQEFLDLVEKPFYTLPGF